MSKPSDGGTAFPRPDSGMGTSGMSLRDYFAGQALAGMQAAAWTEGKTWEHIARAVYQQADAMLAERAKEKT